MADRTSVFPGGIFAASFLAASLTVSPAAADTTSYKIDPAHTQVLFTVERFGFTSVIGQFLDVEGQVRLDEKNPAASSVTAVIKTDSLDAANDKRDQALKGNFWLNTAAHPKIRFTSTAVELTAPDSAKVTGDLTIKGVTKSVILDVKLNRIGQDPATQRKAAGFSASTRISRSAFGIDTAPELIGDNVAIRIEALAHSVPE